MQPVSTPRAKSVSKRAHASRLETPMTENSSKPQSFWHLINIAIGFFGIQVAWAIQIGQVSPLLETLGAGPLLTSIMWCAGPITGIVVQPIVGSLSDRIWTPIGRRRPFLIAGALLTAICLVLMPNSPWLWFAASLLWILDASINICQGPYRALVPDTVPKPQQALTFSLMSFMIGLGSVSAFYIGSRIVDVHNLFYLGAFVICAALGWTVVSVQEKKENVEVSEPQQGFGAFIKETWRNILAMPTETKKLCLMHSMTWFGLQCMFVFFTLYVAHSVYGAEDPHSALYKQGIQTASFAYFLMNLACAVVSPFIGKLCEMTSKKAVHTVGLLCMATGLTWMFFLRTPNEALIAMSILGIGWATTLSVPFAILSEQLSHGGKAGVLMGTFNIFIAAPQFIAAPLTGFIVDQTHNYTFVMLLGGISVFAAAALLQNVKESPVQ